MTRLDAVPWRSPTLAGFHALRAELDDRLGPPSLTDLDSNGVGSFDAYLVRCACGLELALWRFHLAADFRRIDDMCEPAWVELYASEPDADHAAFHAGIAAERLHREVAVVAPRWMIWRQDDNGNRVEVARTTSRCEADAIAGDLEARGHKQMYWVESVAR